MAGPERVYRLVAWDVQFQKDAVVKQNFRPDDHRIWPGCISKPVEMKGNPSLRRGAGGRSGGNTSRVSKSVSFEFYGQHSFRVNTTAENAEVPHLKMLKVDADKTFSASPPDLDWQVLRKPRRACPVLTGWARSFKTPWRVTDYLEWILEKMI